MASKQKSLNRSITEHGLNNAPSPSPVTKKRKLCDVNFFDDNNNDDDDDNNSKTCVGNKRDNTSSKRNQQRTTSASHNGDNDSTDSNKSNNNNQNGTKDDRKSNSDIIYNKSNENNTKDLKTGVSSDKENERDSNRTGNTNNNTNNNNNKKRMKEKLMLSKLSKAPVLGRGLRNEKIDFDEDFLSYDKYTGAEENGMSRLSFGNDKSLADTLNSGAGQHALKRNGVTQNPSRAKVFIFIHL